MPAWIILSRPRMEKRGELGMLLLGTRLSKAIMMASRMENLYRNTYLSMQQPQNMFVQISQKFSNETG
jgi:hypothetical protein